MGGPLDGMRVLDLTKTIAGPYCTQILGDLGADVIKVEQPKVGDDFRSGNPVVRGVSYYFLLFNRNKRSLTLDLKTEEGKEIVYKIARGSDIFVENFRPGTAKRLRVDYATIHEINPKIIYCSVSGFGQDGPYRDRAAYDLVLQGMSGLISFTQDGDAPPKPFGIPLCDLTTAFNAACGILAALVARERTGHGQHVDVSLLDCSVALTSWMAALYFGLGMLGRFSDKKRFLVPYGVFRGSDGYFVLEAGNDATFRRLCEALGLNDLLSEPRVNTIQDRREHRDLILPRLEALFPTKPVAHWLKRLEDAAVPAGPIFDLGAVFSDPQVLHRKMVTQVKHPQLGETKLLGIPVKLSETPGEIRRPPPILGQHTDEILKELGYGESDISSLRARAVI